MIAGSSLGTVSYGYNANGSLSSVETSWAGGYTLHRGVTGLVDEVRDSSTSALLASIDGRDALGRVTHGTGPDGTETSRAYDALGRTTWSAIQNGTTLDDRAYTHDLLGRVEHVDHVDADGAWTQDFEYESPGRLIGDKRMTGGVVTSQVTYAWDAAGNRTSVTRDGVTVVSTYLPGDRLATVGAATVVHDGFGGIIDDGAGFGIPRGADGAEVGVDALSGSTVSPLYTFWRSAAGEPVATEDADGLHRQVWGNPGADLPLAGDGPEGDWLWIAVDGVVLGQLRSGVALGAASDPLGSIAYYDGALAGVPEAFGEGAGVSDVRHGWAGMETLAGTPYQLAQHRLYDTANGRFTITDPIGLAGGDHRYAYGGGDPVQFVDPSGLAYVAPGSTALGVGQTHDGLHTKQLFDAMVTGMGENSGYDQWHDYGTYEDFFSADALHDPQYGVHGPAPDECQGMGCMPASGEPGDEQDGTGIFRESVPVLSADADEKGMTWRERREARQASWSGEGFGANVDVHAKRNWWAAALSWATTGSAATYRDRYRGSHGLPAPRHGSPTSRRSSSPCTSVAASPGFHSIPAASSGDTSVVYRASISFSERFSSNSARDTA